MTQATVERTLPRWDMTPVFPSLDSAELEAALSGIVTSIGELRELFDARDIRRIEGLSVDDGVVATLDEVLAGLNDIYERMRTLRGYVHSFVTTEAQNDLAQARNSELQNHAVELDKLEKRLVAWVGSLDVEAVVERSEVAREHAFALRRMHREATHQMSEAEEDLASGLFPSGQGAWSRLHGNVTSRVMVDVELPAGAERMPMSKVRGLLSDPDPDVREAAYRAELAAWPAVEVPLAAALNSIKGWQNEINARRGWPDSVEPALFANNVDRTTLEAMQEACVESFPDFRRYLKAKARLLGKDACAWWDLVAPVGAEGKHWDWDETAGFIVNQFGSFSEPLAGLAARAFLECWIDAEPREGKRDGGFCMGLRADESRILVNFNHRSGSVATVAHELGHAYHNLCLAERAPLQRRTPMPLAETASTFCETIVTNAQLATATDDEKLAIIASSLERDCAIVVDIHSRFLFEKAVFEGRSKRELSARELCEAITDAQRQTYAEGLDPDALHPYAWANKPHYYGAVHYYNWPYTFGLLFGLGLYATSQKDPDAFRVSYDDLLSSTGMGDAAELAGRFGMDVRSPDFWRSSLDIVRQNIDAFVALAP